MDFLDNSQVTKALYALKVYADKEDLKETDKDELFSDSKELTLQFTLKKVLPNIPNKLIDIKLPHRFVNPKASTICLFVKDLDAKKDYKDHDVDKASRYFKQFLKDEKNVAGLDEVISLSQLRREYKTFESQRKLCTAYDVFFVDDRITPLVAGALGRCFRKAKKMPCPIRIRGDINANIEKYFSTTRFTYKSLCSRCSIKFGSISQPINELLSNLKAVYECIDSRLPAGMKNVRSIHINLANSPLLPVYVSLESANLIKIQPSSSKSKSKPVIDELNTLSDDDEDEQNETGGKKVCVWPSGMVQIVNGGKKSLVKKRKSMINWKRNSGGSSGVKRGRVDKKRIQKRPVKMITIKNEPSTAEMKREIKDETT